MTPALEYLTRIDYFKQSFSAPCSLFLQHRENGKRLVVTVQKQYGNTANYSVKHWRVSACSPEQALPSFTEYSINTDEVFSSPHVVLKGFDPYYSELDSIDTGLNTWKKPMPKFVYDELWEQCLADNETNRMIRYNWLWQQFVRVYEPKEFSAFDSRYMRLFRTDAEIADEQRERVSTQSKRHWQFWLLWFDYMFLTSAELIFLKEYRRRALD